MVPNISQLHTFPCFLQETRVNLSHTKAKAHAVGDAATKREALRHHDGDITNLWIPCSIMAHLVLPFTLLLLVPPSADAYSRGAGSCHTASGGHGEATPGDGGFALSLASAATPGSTLTLQLAHTLPETQFKGFLVKVTGPGGGYDDGGASFTGLDAHALAQPKECYGPSTATHRSSDLKDAVELELALPAEPVELIATVIVMISRQSSMDSEWYTWTVPISVAEQAVEPPPAPVRCRPDGSRCPLILSLQPQDEWDTGHVSCANRILDDDVGFDDPALGAAVLELAGGDTTTPIVTYCYSGNEFVFGMFVEPELTVAGFTDVTNGGAFVEPSEAVDWNNDEVLEELCVCDSPCGSPAAAAAAACPSDVVRHSPAKSSLSIPVKRDDICVLRLTSCHNVCAYVTLCARRATAWSTSMTCSSSFLPSVARLLLAQRMRTSPVTEQST
jgi:hypothetical protein